MHMIYDPRQREQLEFRFVEGNREILSVRGHRYSAFRTLDDVLFFADYLPDAPGCSVAAYDLATGKEIWRTDLHQEQPKGASGYRNRVIMLVHPDEEPLEGETGKEQSSIEVRGSESYCDYIEVLDAQTGASLAIKNYRVGFNSSEPTKQGVGDSQTDKSERAQERPSTDRTP